MSLVTEVPRADAWNIFGCKQMLASTSNERFRRNMLPTHGAALDYGVPYTILYVVVVRMIVVSICSIASFFLGLG